MTESGLAAKDASTSATPITSVTSDTSATSTTSAAVELRIFEAIQKTRPRKDDTSEHEFQLFELAGWLKGILGGVVPESKLKAIVSSWHQDAVSKRRCSLGFDETWLIFDTAWSDRRFGKGEHPLSNCIQAIESGQEIPPAAIRSIDLEAVRRLVACCWVIQKNIGDRAIILSSGDVGKYFANGDRKQGWRIIDYAERRGWLILVGVRQKPNANGGKANRYRFNATKLQTEGGAL